MTLAIINILLLTAHKKTVSSVLINFSALESNAPSVDLLQFPLITFNNFTVFPLFRNQLNIGNICIRIKVFPFSIVSYSEITTCLARTENWMVAGTESRQWNERGESQFSKFLENAKLHSISRCSPLRNRIRTLFFDTSTGENAEPLTKKFVLFASQNSYWSQITDNCLYICVFLSGMWLVCGILRAAN